MVTFHVDLDNTLIYSYKHDIGEDKLEVELYNGRNISYLSSKTYNMLKILQKKLMIVPTTTRTIEQYKRINLNIGHIKYALVCNGGILLIDGIKDEKWYEDSLKLTNVSRTNLQKGIELLEKEPKRTFEIRFIEELFVFTKCDDPECVVENLKSNLDTKLADVFNNGTKVYILPKKLTKGNAVKRFQQYIGSKKVIAAGDSEFDVSMLEAADISIAPKSIMNRCSQKQNIKFVDEQILFSEAVMNEVLQVI